MVHFILYSYFLFNVVIHKNIFKSTSLMQLVICLIRAKFPSIFFCPSFFLNQNFEINTISLLWIVKFPKKKKKPQFNKMSKLTFENILLFSEVALIVFCIGKSQHV